MMMPKMIFVKIVVPTRMILCKGCLMIKIIIMRRMILLKYDEERMILLKSFQRLADPAGFAILPPVQLMLSL